MGKVENKDKVLKVWVDGCFDMGHFGHVNLLRQAKEAEIVPGMKNYLVVGVHSDEEIARHKRLPIFTEQERVEMVRSCKYVDEVVPNAPYITTVETLDRYGCQYTVHGSDLSTSASGVDTYAEVKEAQRYFEVERTLGISTTSLIKRVLNDTGNVKGYTGRSSVDEEYYATLMRKMKNVTVNNNTDLSKVIYVEGSFDLYHPGHVRFLKEAKKKGSYLVVNVFNDDTVKVLAGQDAPYMKQHERALTVMGNRYVDEVILGVEFCQIPPEMRKMYKNMEVFYGLDELEYAESDLDQEQVTTTRIKDRIMERHDELMSKNAKKEAREEELASNLMEKLKVV